VKADWNFKGFQLWHIETSLIRTKKACRKS
jgi:hypothetical protein